MSFYVLFPGQDHQDCYRPPITAEHSSTLAKPNMTTIQADTAIPSGDGHAPPAWERLEGVLLNLIEPDGAANGRQRAPRVGMRTVRVTGFRR
jgi:hypothetical protein